LGAGLRRSARTTCASELPLSAAIHLNALKNSYDRVHR
jgi:hypothetical protein